MAWRGARFARRCRAIVEIVKVALALVRDSECVRGKACSPGAMFERAMFEHAMVPGVVGENAAPRIPKGAGKAAG